MKAKLCIEKLRRLGVLNEWELNQSKYSGRTTAEYAKAHDGETFESFVACAFVFEDTKEGFQFWRNIADS